MQRAGVNALLTLFDDIRPSSTWYATTSAATSNLNANVAIWVSSMGTTDPRVLHGTRPNMTRVSNLGQSNQVSHDTDEESATSATAASVHN